MDAKKNVQNTLEWRSHWPYLVILFIIKVRITKSNPDIISPCSNIFCLRILEIMRRSQYVKNYKIIFYIKMPIKYYFKKMNFFFTRIAKATHNRKHNKDSVVFLFVIFLNWQNVSHISRSASYCTIGCSRLSWSWPIDFSVFRSHRSFEKIDNEQALPEMVAISTKIHYCCCSNLWSYHTWIKIDHFDILRDYGNTIKRPKKCLYLEVNREINWRGDLV